MSIRLGDDELDLADLLDRALNKGVVIWGEAVISLAGVELVYVGLKVLVASYDTARKYQYGAAERTSLPERRVR
jgi:gas vesicle structural protein